ncbi:hypothetical protein NMG60_11001904 [Bertholletia excelsa]
MAQFTAQGRLRPLFSCDGMPVGSEPKDHPRHHYHHHYKILGGGLAVPLGFHKRKLIYHQYQGSSNIITKLFASRSRSSSASKSNQFDAESRFIVGNYGIADDEQHADFERDELSCFRGLVLDISYRKPDPGLKPPSPRPVNVVCWKRAICLEFMEKADVLEYYDQTVNSPNGSFYIPAVLRVPHLLQVVKRRRIKNTLSRKNIFYRDNFTCQGRIATVFALVCP